MLTGNLYPFQEVAVDKALARGNLLIAYGMGLGKTPVQLGICEELVGQDLVSMSAIVCQAGLKWQWAQQIALWTDVDTRTVQMKDEKIVVPVESQCMVIDGTPKRRAEKYEYAIKYRPDYILLGYENVVNDWHLVKQLEPDLISLDEATAIKSFKAQRTKQIKRWDAPYRYELTGTPIDNRPEELYSLMQWLDPDVLGRYDIFDRAYIVRNHWGGIVRYKHLDVLHEIIQDAMIRRTRHDKDVSAYMPNDYHKEFYISPDKASWRLYKQIAAVLVEEIEEIRGSEFNLAEYYSGGASFGDEAQGRVMAKVQALNMLSDHPALLHKSAKLFDAYMHGESNFDGGSQYIWELWKNGDLEGLPSGSPKLTAVLGKIRDLLDEHPKNKIICFSFYKEMLEIIGRELGSGYVIYNGDMSITEKEAAKMRFKRDPDTRVFLSSDAGGMGVDLPEANYLINYDLPWSAGKMDQRNSRHIRASSKWEEVFILNYMVEGSLEVRTFAILDLKRRVGSAILDGAKPPKGVIENDVETLKDALLAAL